MRLLILLLPLLALPASATVYQCLHKGEISYQDNPCPGATPPLKSPPSKAATRSDTLADIALPEPSIPPGPPRALAAGAEIVLVSGYESETRQVRVDLDRPGKRVLLVLSSYHAIDWLVVPSARTQLSAVLYSKTASDGEASVKAGKAARYPVALPYSYEADNKHFVQILAHLNGWFGRSSVDSFHGAYSLARQVSIRQPDAPNPMLTLQGPAAQNLPSQLEFGLWNTEQQLEPWTVNGPRSGRKQGYGDIALQTWDEAGKVVYTLENDQLVRSERRSGKRESFALPGTFPRLSWPTALAYDTRRHIVTLSSLGGEGFLYRFNARSGKWLDYRSLDNLDLNALSYDAKADRYMGWSSEGSLVFLSHAGQLQTTRRILDQLSGFGRGYDRGNESIPRLALYASSPEVALVRIDAGVVEQVWHYNFSSGKATLSYSARQP